MMIPKPSSRVLLSIAHPFLHHHQKRESDESCLLFIYIHTQTHARTRITLLFSSLITLFEETTED